MVLAVNLNQFNKELEQFAETLLPEQVTLFQRAIAIDLLARVIEKTPVKTGRARGAWQLAVGAPNESEGEPDKAGVTTAAKGVGAITDLPPFSIVWLSNNVVYIEFLENGSSSQAPAGMLAVSLEEIRQSFA